jgi:hypothetical protein
MAGQSDKEKASQEYYNSLKGMPDYTNPFSYGDKAGALDKYFTRATDDVNRNANDQILRSNKGIAARLASQGIGGSALGSAIDESTAGINNNRFNAIQGLKTSQAGQTSTMLDQANQDKMNEYLMRLRKSGMLGNSIQGLDDDTWLSNMMGVLTTGANVGTSIAKLI